MTRRRTKPAPELVQHAIWQLASYEAVDIHEAYELIGGVGDLHQLPDRAFDCMCDLLETLGYRGRWIAKVGEEEGRFMWVRGPWPIDFWGPRASCEKEAYVAF